MAGAVQIDWLLVVEGELRGIDELLGVGIVGLIVAVVAVVVGSGYIYFGNG
jgi:hypothetical protein